MLVYECTGIFIPTISCLALSRYSNSAQTLFFLFFDRSIQSI